jgi:hypothetical protein
MRTALTIVVGCVSWAQGEIIPHAATLNVTWEFSGQPPQTGTASYNAAAEVLTIAGPNPESVEYQYPSGLVFQTGTLGVFLTLSPLGGSGQHVPVAPFHWENTLSGAITYTIDFSIVLSSQVQGRWRSYTPGTAYQQPAIWTLLEDVRLAPGGNPALLPALTIMAGSTLATVPGPAMSCILLLAPIAARRRR